VGKSIGKHSLEQFLQPGEASCLNVGQVSNLDHDESFETCLNFRDFYANDFQLTIVFLGAMHTEERN